MFSGHALVSGGDGLLVVVVVVVFLVDFEFCFRGELSVAVLTSQLHINLVAIGNKDLVAMVTNISIVIIGCISISTLSMIIW